MLQVVLIILVYLMVEALVKLGEVALMLEQAVVQPIFVLLKVIGII